MINEATKISFGGGGPGGINGNDNGNDNDNSDKLMKPLAGYIGYNSEWRELAQTISRVSREFVNVLLANYVLFMSLV